MSLAASIPGFSEVWFDCNAISNIFGFADLVKNHHITYDADIEDAFWYTWEIKSRKLYHIVVKEDYKYIWSRAMERNNLSKKTIRDNLSVGENF